MEKKMQNEMETMPTAAVIITWNPSWLDVKRTRPSGPGLGTVPTTFKLPLIQPLYNPYNPCSFRFLFHYPYICIHNLVSSACSANETTVFASPVAIVLSSNSRRKMVLEALRKVTIDGRRARICQQVQQALPPSQISHQHTITL